MKIWETLGLVWAEAYLAPKVAWIESGLTQEINKVSITTEITVKNTQSPRKLFLQGNYFHAVFEAAKAYNRAVKEKSHSDKDGVGLMMDVFNSKSGVLKITKCISETDINVQDGIKFLSSGLMQAIRNPTAHEPAVTWPINKQDCLDILSLISFLF